MRSFCFLAKVRFLASCPRQWQMNSHHKSNLNVTLTIYRISMTMDHGQGICLFAAVNLTQITDLM